MNYILAFDSQAPKPPLENQSILNQRPSIDGLFVYDVVVDDQILDTLKEFVHSCMSKKLTALLLPNRSFKAVFFDMDSTVVAQESIVELAAFAGRSQEVHEITEKAMAGELDFDEALRARVATLKDQPAAIIEKTCHNFTINPKLDTFSEEAQKAAIPLFLISGGFKPLAAFIGQKLNFTGWHANELEVKDQQLTGRVEGAIVNGQAKKDFVATTCAKLNLSPADVVAVGDGANDLDMLAFAGLALGYGPKPVLLPSLDGAMFGDFAALKLILQAGR